MGKVASGRESMCNKCRSDTSHCEGNAEQSVQREGTIILITKFKLEIVITETRPR